MNYKYALLGLFTVMFTLIIVGCEGEEEKHFTDENWTDADYVRGGILYDKWWKVNGGTEPASDFNPIWASQSTNTRSGGDTWRCKECHGWDYVGKDGRYSSGSHYTGFEGVWDAKNEDKADIFDAIKGEGKDHDLSAVLDDNDVLDLTKFITNGLVDMSLYIDANGAALGSATNGQTLYDANCAACHGTDGNTLDFKSADGIQGVGWLANDNPQETLHKIRWGHPGSSPEMPSMVGAGLTDQETGDILAYSQTLPAAAFVNANWDGAHLVSGGLLYDKWWKINGETEPTSNFDPIWASQSTNTRSGGDTWRCKECHGWDYVGKDGRYSSGSHYTGFEGVRGAKDDDKLDIFNAIKDEGGHHDLSSVLDDNDVLNLTKFVVDGLVDMSLYIDANGAALGSASNGQTLYDADCASCHGTDGKTIDFKSADGIQGVGWLANDNPQETLHKIRWGHPGSQMPSMVGAEKSDQDCGDILSYAQSLPQQ